MKNNRLRKIFSFVISAAIVLSALIIVPATHIVEAEAAYDASHGMYSSLKNVFTGAELHGLVNTFNQMSYSYDNNEKALKLTINNATSDPYIGFNLSGANIDLSTYTRVVVIYKMPNTNKQEWQRVQFFWWNQNNDLKYSGDYDSNCAWYRCGAYYFDIRPNLLTSGKLTTFRMDPMTWAQFWNVGDTIYVDSIAFFKDDNEAQLYRREREAVRNKENDSFTITPSAFAAQNAFSALHNVNVSYNSNYNTFQITTANNCSYLTANGGAWTDSCPNGGGKYRCWDAAKNGLTASAYPQYQTVLDPTVTLNCNVDTSKYKYAVISFMLPHKSDIGTLAGAGLTVGSTAIFDSRYDEGEHKYTYISPIFNGTSSNYGVTSQYTLGENGYYYTQIIDLSAAGGNGLVGFRIDPINYTFSKLGVSLHLKQITFTTNANTAISSAEEMLRSMTGYASFQLSVNYNGNALPNTSVNNIPSTSGTPFNYVSRPDSINWPYTVSGTTPTSSSGIKFDGWAISPDSSVVVQPGGTFSIAGAKGTVTKPTLYAKWHYAYGYITLSVNNTLPNVDPNQTYIFRITGSGVNTTVAIKGNGSVQFYLQAGTYAIACLNDWSWRYASSGAQNPTVTDNGNAQVVFTFTSKNDKWLNGFAQYPN